MLPVINLDDENFKDIFEEARKMISGLYPAWTDYNEHDPGITFLELFSWLKEMQQFHMNQIGRNNQLMYLKLLGMKQEKKKPAQTLIYFSSSEKDKELAKRSRLYAGNICFETTEREIIEECRILQIISRSRTRENAVEEGILDSGSTMRFYAFLEQPQKGNEFLIKFDKPISSRKIHSIYFKIYEEYRIKRNAVSEDFSPLASYSLSCYGENGWEKCEIINDETCQMIRSGKLYFRHTTELKEMEGGYFIKFTLEESNYDVPPILQEISLNVLKAVQTDTFSEFEDYVLERREEESCQLVLDSSLARNGLQDIYILEGRGYRRLENYRREDLADCVILTFDELFADYPGNLLKLRIVNYKPDFDYRRTYEADGFPYQTFALEDGNILYDSLEIFVENELYPGYFEQWEKVDNFACSSEADMHYVLEEENGSLRFGDGENGKVPEGSVVIIGYADCLGVGGNVKAGQINIIPEGPQMLEVMNKENAKDGCDKETIEECFGRFIRQFRQVNRAITNEDYEKIIFSTPGLMIENVKTIPVSLKKQGNAIMKENCVTVVVQPYSPIRNGVLNSAYLRNINTLLNKRRLIGTKVNILSPEYIGISLFVEVAIKPHYLNAHDTIKNAVEDYFKVLGSEFGKPVLFNEIYGIIDVLDCVSQVQDLSVSTQGKGVTRNMNGDLILPPYGLVYLMDAQYQVSYTQ